MPENSPKPTPAPLSPTERLKLLTKLTRELSDLTDRDRQWAIAQLGEMFPAVEQ